VREEALAYAVWGGRDGTVDPGLLRIEVAVRDPERLADVERVVREEVAKLAAGVEPAALDALRTRLRYQLLSSLDDPMNVLHVLGIALRRDPDPASIDRFRDAMAAATAEEVSAAVRDVLVDAGLTVGTLTPPKEAE
jgi:predicted Zn-dependent peptidase